MALVKVIFKDEVILKAILSYLVKENFISFLLSQNTNKILHSFPFQKYKKMQKEKI